MCCHSASLFSEEQIVSMIPDNDETIEDLQLDGLQLIQKKNAFRFGMDSVLLAHFANIRESDTVADFGTGNGVLLFLLKGRKKGKRYYAFEIQEEAAELAERNVRLNRLEDSMTVIHADARDALEYIQPCSVDAVICNPPYGQPGAVLASPRESKSIARNQKEDTLDRMLKGAFSILKGRGKFILVYPASQMFSIMTKLRSHHLEPKVFQLAYPYIHKPADLVLIEAVKDARPTLHTRPPLIIYNQDGSLTNELKSVYHIQEQTEF